MADLGEAGGSERVAAPDVDRVPADPLPGLREQRVALDRTGAAAPRKGDCRARQRVSDTPAAEAGAGEDARHGPDAAVGLVLVPALPRNAVVADKADVGSPRLDRAPADRLAVEQGDEPARRLGLRVAAEGLLAEWTRAFLDRELGERLLRPELVPLTLAVGRGASRAEHRLERLAGRVVRGNDGEPVVRRWSGLW